MFQISFSFSQGKKQQTIAEVLQEMPADRRYQVKIHLQKLRNLVQECMGYDEQPQVIEHATLFLFWLMLEQKVITIAATIRIRSIFGAIFGNRLAIIHQTVWAVRELLEDYEVDELKKWKKGGGKKSKNQKLWGDHIKLKFQKMAPEELTNLMDLAPTAISKNPASMGFSMQWNQEPSSTSKYHKVVDTFLEMSQKEEQSHFIISLTELLNSKKSNNELQNDLIELLGFDYFDLVQQVLKDRNKIATQLQELEQKEKRTKRTKQLQQKQSAKHTNGGGGPELRPTVASQVVVQSALEKELGKQSRREEKKIQRLMHSMGRSDKDDDDQVQVLNPMQLRLQQQRRMLEVAQHQPLLKHTQELKEFRSTLPTQVRYPYVFDSQLEAKQHAGFIGGNRISLPETAERIDTKQYEEVKIPATEPPPLSVGNNRINISDLDDIGQMAFSNCKQLNRIQSVVYPVAYHSNENMLVCAPTGAGKTNVAMLAIVHTIRAHLENGIINRDQFKIVYIAPMKALASEMVQNFSKRLKELNIVVKELTGDMQLTKTEMQQTQILVTTPEKWDVVTRKGKC